MGELAAERRSGLPGPAVGAGTRPCPRCGSAYLRPAETAGSKILFCTGCHRCWRFEEDGYLREVDPSFCPGCVDRGACRALGYGRESLHWEESP